MSPHDPPALLAQIEQILSRPPGDPAELHALLAALFDHCRNQQHVLDRLIRISDGYQRAERERGSSYLERYHRELHRLERIVRISDRYQDMLRDINSQLERMANTDILTDLPNRRCAIQQVEQNMQQAQAADSALCVALVDIDHFKRINDSFGHPVGDQAIRWIARLMADSLPADQFCARWGGEEFLILLRTRDNHSAARLLEDLRSMVAVSTFPHAGQQISLSISIGVCHLQADDNLHSLLKRADDALYQAKTLGRNRISQLD